MKCDEIRVLLSALVDNELDAEQKRKVGDHLASCEDCRKEYAKLKRLKEATSEMSYFDLPDKLWAGYWREIYNRIERGIGWFFLSIGAIILLVLGAWELLDKFFLDARISLIPKLGVGAVILGLVILLVSIGRERLFSRRHDRYEEVEL